MQASLGTCSCEREIGDQEQCSDKSSAASDTLGLTLPKLQVSDSVLSKAGSNCPIDFHIFLICVKVHTS